MASYYLPLVVRDPRSHPGCVPSCSVPSPRASEKPAIQRPRDPKGMRGERSSQSLSASVLPLSAEDVGLQLPPYRATPCHRPNGPPYHSSHHRLTALRTLTGTFLQLDLDSVGHIRQAMPVAPSQPKRTSLANH